MTSGMALIMAGIIGPLAIISVGMILYMRYARSKTEAVSEDLAKDPDTE